jgi:hypothetical protein
VVHLRRLIVRQIATSERFADCPRQAGSDWVPEHVVNVTLGTLVRPENVVKESDLPKTLSGAFRILKACFLLPYLHEPPNVGEVGQALDHEMHVVRHEAVRKNPKLI